MPRVERLTVGALAALALGLTGAAARSTRQQPAPRGSDPGRAVYTKWCAGCHGDQGKGDGPAAGHLLPKPRDFTRALYQVRSTATGEIPTDDDIRRAIDEGMPGSSMPPWKNTLTSGERAALVQYLKSFSNAFATPPTRLRFGGAPRGGSAAIEDGRRVFNEIQCFKCHGQAGRGDGPSAPTLKDDFGNPILAADLTQNWNFNGGPAAQDIYHRLRTGLDGTPMPSFSDLIDAHRITEDQLWHVAQYVRSLSPAQPPTVHDVVSAPRIEGALPTGPDDSAWTRAGRYYFPLVGQVILKPRIFAPTVNGVWVQALHNGQSLALRVTWHDPSQSPDTAWNVWRARLSRVMTSDDSGAAADSGRLPDRLVVQFPAHLAEGTQRPYFLMGSTEQPVYLWQWESAPRGAVEGLAKGAGHFEPLAGATDSLTSSAAYDHGEWRVQLSRALVTADSASQLQFATGRPIPMAFFAWDGSNGETGTRMSVGSWVAIYLGEPARAGTYVWPLLAMLGTGGLGLLVVVRAQRATARKPN